MSVTGPVPASALGIVLPHEHVLWRSHYVDHPSAAMQSMRTNGDAPITDDLVPVVARNPFATSDNLRQTDVDLATAELTAFRAAGGGTVVDVTCNGLGRRATDLAKVARATGLTIMAATGYYLAATHPSDLATRSASSISEELLRELTVGIDGTDVRAGIMGELGVGQPMYGEPRDGAADRALIDPMEERVLHAAAAAHRETGAPISLHLWNFGPNRLARRALDILEGDGVAPARVALGHVDAFIDLDAIREVARRGAFVEFDAFGVEPYGDWDDSHFDTDEQRLDAVTALLDEGLGDRLLLSQDVCTRTQLHRYGGPGYDHLERVIVPALRARGADDATLHQLRVANPVRLLTWAA
jgi:phosphotriesterase-related protein